MPCGPAIARPCAPLIAKKADVNATQVDGTTALHLASTPATTRPRGCCWRPAREPTAANRYGVTPIALAARNGSAALIEALVKAGADPNTASREGETALMTAARSGSLAAVRALLALGANPNAAETWHEQTALMWAAADNQAAIAAALLEAGADVNARAKVLARPAAAAAGFRHVVPVGAQQLPEGRLHARCTSPRSTAPGDVGAPRSPTPAPTRSSPIRTASRR